MTPSAVPRATPGEEEAAGAASTAPAGTLKGWGGGTADVPVADALLCLRHVRHRHNGAVPVERRVLRKRAAPEGGASGQRERAARVDGASGRRERVAREGGTK